MLSRRATTSGALALLLLLAAAACDKQSKPDGQPGQGAPAPATGEAKTTFEGVEYADRAVVIDDAAMRSGLRGQDGTKFRFAEGTAGVDKLTAGSVVLFTGTAVRKVTSTRKSGGEVVVDTTDAKLNELIKNGKLGWSGPVNWSKIPRESFRDVKFGSSAGPILANVPDVVSAQDTSIVKKWTIDGVEVELKLIPKADKLEFEMEAKRAPTLRLTGKGSISNFGFTTDLEYHQGTGQLISSQVLDIKGEGELAWSAVGIGTSGIDTEVVRLKLPFEVPFPILIGGVPFVLKVKSEIRIVPVLAKDSSSGGSFKISYDTDHGFTTSGSLVNTPKATSKVRTAGAELGSEETVTAGFVPVGFAWGWEFPRFELSLAGTGTFVFITQDTYLSGEFTPGTTLTGDIPPCQKAAVTMQVISGYKMEVLGFPVANSQTKLWEKKIEKFKDNKPCTLTGKPG